MAYYAIGIGGTGAKCLESLIHLAAAGMMPDDSELHVLFVDPDKANGSLERAQNTLTLYQSCKDNLQLGETPLLKTKITSPNHNWWSPLGGNDANPSLREFFGYNRIGTVNPDAARLFDVLYSPTEGTTPLDQGFRGHPSIGAAIMASAVDLEQQEPWATLSNRLGQEDDAKIFLAGSIFGGTGASGFPTIATLVKNQTEHVKMGGALVLPYFKFVFPPNDEQVTAELKAKSEDFLMNTQAALKYYQRWGETGNYDAVYLVGNESQTEVTASLGGNDQKNAPHFIELYAALAAIHFFDPNFEANAEHPYFLIARSEQNQLQWSDLPDENNGRKIQSQMGRLARFAFAYRNVYGAMLQDIRAKGRLRYRAPWCVDFFKRNSTEIDETRLNNVDSYCNAFLRWLTDIQTNHGENERIQLVTEKPLEELEPNDFSNLIQTTTEVTPKTLNKLWERMSDGRGADSNANGIGKFLSALYYNCMESDPGTESNPSQ